jgi:Tfp pilus assembly protein PilZ
MLEDTAEARLRCSSISLEDGADEAWLNGEPIGFCEGGICFPSRWKFDPGTTLALTLEICESGERARAEGVVAWCERLSERLWSVTVLFLETPADMAKIRNSKLELRSDFHGTLLH